MRANLKALGLALLAVFAVSAVVASSAQATSNFTTKNNVYPAVATDHEENGTHWLTTWRPHPGTRRTAKT